MEEHSRKLPGCSNCSQGGGIAIYGGTVNIISCTINNNQAEYVSTRAGFEQRAHHNAPLM